MATDIVCSVVLEKKVFRLDQVLASYLKTANLAKYDTTEPQRMLLGKPAVSEQPAKGQQGSKGSKLVKIHNQLVTTK